MILFQCDYNEGAHPRIMERMMETNLKQSPRLRGRRALPPGSAAHL